MPSDSHLVAVVLVAALVTFLLRAVPFALLSRLRESRLIPWLGVRMPVGIMVILAVYTVHDVQWTDVGRVVPLACGLVVTVGLHLWRHNPVLSIVSGTLVCIAASALLG